MNVIQPSVTERKCSTITEFCQEHRISRAFFYQLKEAGKAPRIIMLGAKRLITVEDAAAWRQAMAEQSAA